jgi:hypothetical protein
MGGLGSGRPATAGRSIVEGCRSLDINKLHRRGCLAPGWSGGWQWTIDNRQVAWIGLRAEYQRLRLSYRIRIGGGDWEDVDETVGVVAVPCHLGGTRPYFICPGVVSGLPCGRRVGKLHGAGRYFLCRHCYGLNYASQGEDSLDRARRRTDKLRRRLDGSAGVSSAFPARPKGMWARTYHRLRDRFIDAEVEADELFEAKAGQLLARINDRHSKRSFW